MCLSIVAGSSLFRTASSIAQNRAETIRRMLCRFASSSMTTVAIVRLMFSGSPLLYGMSRRTLIATRLSLRACTVNMFTKQFKSLLGSAPNTVRG